MGELKKPPRRSSTDGINYDGLPDLVGYRLRKAQVAVFANFARTMADRAITPGQFGVLTLIGANAGLTQSALAKAVGIERSTMVAVLDGLERRGLIERRPSPHDRRSHALILSDAGATLLAELRKLVAVHERRILSDLSAVERKALIGLLARLSGGG
jgi:DNA-binding MarR family transcriptional regulator